MCERDAPFFYSMSNDAGEEGDFMSHRLRCRLGLPVNLWLPCRTLAAMKPKSRCSIFAA